MRRLVHIGEDAAGLGINLKYLVLKKAKVAIYTPHGILLTTILGYAPGRGFETSEAICVGATKCCK